MLREQLNYNLRFGWFVGLNLDEEVGDVTVFTKSRGRWLKADVAPKVFQLVVKEAQARDWMSDEHLTVEGTLREACASLKSFQKIDEAEKEKSKTGDDDPGHPSVDFQGEQRSNQTPQSTTDAEARLARKGAGKEAKLSYSGLAAASRVGWKAVPAAHPSARRQSFQDPVGNLRKHIYHIAI